MSMDSLLAQITNARQKLSPTDTKVTTADGRELVEKRRTDGSIRTTQVGVRPWGFVGDFKPDLQLAEVSPNLFLCGQDVAHEFELMKERGVTHILNIASIVENVFPTQFTYLRIQLLDIPTSNILPHFPLALEFLRNAIQDGGRALVHCNAGVSRSSSIVIAYKMKFESMSFEDAFEQVKTIRPCVRPNEGFMKQLREYESQITNNGHGDP